MAWKVVEDKDGSSKIIISEPGGSTAEVLLHGGQVVSWKNDRHEELLFMNTKNYAIREFNLELEFPNAVKMSKSMIKHPKTLLRGGILICFPQFGDFGPLEFHGFARNKLWVLDPDPSPLPPPRTNSSVDILLKSTDEDFKIWPHSFELRLRITLGPGKLVLIPRVRNVENKVFSFTFGIRNFLSVSDVSEIRVEGLETLDFLDILKKKERYTEQADAITFDGEVDRVYLSTPSKIAIIDHEKKRTLVLRKEGLPDSVVWNPWDKKVKVIPDLLDKEYKSILCVDSTAIESPITLKPLEEWKGYEELSGVSSSYCSGQLDPRQVLYG